MSSPSAGFLLLRGARPGPGKMHSIFARAQLEHGCFLSHFTLRLRQVTQDLGLNPAAAAPDAPLKLPPLGLETRSFALAGAACSTWSPMVGAVECCAGSCCVAGYARTGPLAVVCVFLRRCKCCVSLAGRTASSSSLF
jgi:hypothetical protein